MGLIAENFFQDPRVGEAREAMLRALAEHQNGITAPRPAEAGRAAEYEAMIKAFGESRGGNLYFPYLGTGAGNGPLVELADGSVKFDMICGIGVHHFGHGNPRLARAAFDAALRDTVMQGNLQQNVESTRLAGDLLQRAGPGSALAHCFFTTSGAMANENALKLAFHKRPGTTRVLAFEHTFAGRTLALSAITDKAAYRVGMPATVAVDYVPFFDADDPHSVERSLAVMRGHLARYPNQHAAFWCELVLGEGGFYPGSAEFFTALMSEARAKNVVVVADEVQTFGRTSALFAFQHFGLEKLVDIVTVGKMLQLCATIFTDALKPTPGIVSQTFTASTSAIFAAEAILKDLLTPEMFGADGRNMRVHAKFVARFEKMAREHPGWIRGPFGVGGMVAFTPCDGSEGAAKKLLQGLFQNGVIAFYNGSHPTRVRILPPVPVMADAHIDAVCDIVERTLAQVAT